MNQSADHTAYGTKTLVICALLAISGALVAYFTEWMIAIPFLFSLGIPMVNSRRPLRSKIGTTLLILVGTIVIFSAAVILMLNIEYSRMVLQAAVVGAAGCLVLILNGLMIKSIHLNFWSILVTFLLAAASIPIGMWMTKTLPATGGSFFSNFIGQYGIMILWMLLTTGGVVYAMKKDSSAPEL